MRLIIYVILIFLQTTAFAQHNASDVNFSVKKHLNAIEGNFSENSASSFVPEIELFRVENINSQIADDLLIYNFSEQNNFPANSVYKIKKDKKGYLWLSTNKGLIKFDGNTFYKFNLPDSLNNIEIRGITIDHENNIWFCVYEKALIKYDGTKMMLMSPIATDVKIRELFIASDSTLWIGCDNGYAIYKNEKFKKYTFDVKKSGAKNLFAVIHFSEDAEKDIWMGVFGHNLIQFKKNELYEYNLKKLNDLQSHYNLHKIPKIIHFEDGKSLLCSRFSGIFLMQNDSIIFNFNPKIISFSADKTYTDFAKFGNNYFVSTNLALLKFNTELTQVSVVESSFLRGIKINCLTAEEKIMYAGKDNGFCIIYKTPIKKYSPLSAKIEKILCKQSTVYIATTKELYELTSEDSLKLLPINLSHFSIGNNELMDIRNEKILNVFKNSGYAIFNKNDPKYVNYYSDYIYEKEWNKYILPENAASQAYFLNDSMIISFGSYVLCVVNINTSKLIKKINLNAEILKAEKINSINNYLFSTKNKLYKYNYKNDSIKELLVLETGNIQNFTIEKDFAWIYSHDGRIYKYNHSTGTQATSFQLKQLQKYIINKIQVIDNYIFISSNGGIHFFEKNNTSSPINLLSLNTNEQSNGNIGNYSFDYSENKKKIFYSHDNSLYNISLNEIANKTSITATIPQFIVNETNYTNHISTKQIELPYDSTDLTIHFSAINSQFEYAQDYYYKLEGYDKIWNKTSNNPIITYSNIAPGHYTLKYYVVSESGSTGTTEELKIIILPPFWQTWWFNGIIILLIIILIRWYFLYSKNKANKKLQEENQRLSTQNEIIELEQKLLRTQMNPHFIFNSLNSIKTFVQKNNSTEAAIYLADFASLMRLILESSRKEFISLEDEIKILQFYLRLEQLRLNNSFDYEFVINEQVEDDNEFIKIPPMLLQPFVENAIKHGIENSSEKGKILLSFNYFSANQLIIEIEDNGIGIENKKSNETHSTHESYALKITKERTNAFEKKYNKIISIEVKDLNTENKTGTKVTIILPLID